MKPRYRPPIKHSTSHVHWIADFMRRERVKQKMTQIELADKASMSNSSIGQYEEGKSSLSSLYTIERILAALGYELRIRKRKR